MLARRQVRLEVQPEMILAPSPQEGTISIKRCRCRCRTAATRAGRRGLLLNTGTSSVTIRLVPGGSRPGAAVWIHHSMPAPAACAELGVRRGLGP